MFNVLNCIVWLIVGGIAGTLAGRLLRGRGYGPLGDVLLGLIGSVVGGLLLGLLGLRLAWLPGICANIVVAIIGAVAFVWLMRLFLDKDFAR